MRDADRIARTVDAAVDAIPGVLEVFSSRPLVGRVLRQAMDDDAPRAHVTGEEAGREVTVSVGVSGANPAHATARAVADAVRAALDEPAAAVTVRIVRIVGR